MAKHVNLSDLLNPSIRTDTVCPINKPSDGDLIKPNMNKYMPYQTAYFGIQPTSFDLQSNPQIDVEQFNILGTPQSTKELDLPPDASSEYGEDLTIDQDTQNEIEAIVRSLHAAIDASFQRRAGEYEEQLYHLPEDYKSFTVKQKIKLARDIAEQLALEMQNSSFGSSTRKSKEDAVNKPHDVINYQICSNGNVNIMKLNRDKEDVLYKIFSVPSQGLALSNAELRDIASLLIGAVRDSASHELKEKMKKLQKKYEEVSEKLVRLNVRMKEIQDEEQLIINENEQLKVKLKVTHLQIQSLEKQLEDAIVEAFIHQEKSESLASQLSHSRSIVERLISRVPSDDVCLLLENDKPLTNKLCKDSPLPSNIRYIYNSEENGIKRNSIDGGDLYIIRSNANSSPSTPHFLQRKIPIHNTEEEEIIEEV